MSRNKTSDEIKFAQMIGANMKYLRLRKVFSPMKVLAHHLGMTHQQVAKYESGKNIPCSYRLTQIADYYKVKTDDLINPDFINCQTKTPQDAGYLKPQKDIGSLEEIKAELIKSGIDPRDTILPSGFGGKE